MLVLALGITAVQLVPTYRLVAVAGRTGGIPLHDAVGPAVDTRNLGSLMFAAAPDGRVPHESWEMSSYIGWLLPALALLGAATSRQRRQVGFFVVLAGVALWLATGGYLFALHHAVFPMFRIPGRFMSFWAISAGVLGASSLDALMRWATGRFHVGKAVGYGALSAAAVVSLVDLASYDEHFVEIGPLRDQYAAEAPVRPSAFGRVLSLCEDSLRTSELTALGIPSADGYNSYFLGDYARLFERIRGEPPKTQRTAFPRIHEPANVQDVAAMSVLNVTELVSCEPLDTPGLELVARTERFYVYRNRRAPGRVAVACPPERRTPDHDLGICNDEARIQIQKADTPSGVLRFHIAQDRANLLWLAEPYYPERRAWVDDVPVSIEKTHIALSALRVDAGAHVVELRFVPTSLYYGAAVSLAVLVLWPVGVSWSRRRGPTENDGAPSWPTRVRSASHRAR